MENCVMQHNGQTSATGCIPTMLYDEQSILQGV